MARPGTSIPVPCFQCTKIRNVPPSRLKITKRHFCSRNCQTTAKKVYQRETTRHLQRRLKKRCKRCRSAFQVHVYRRHTAIYCSTSCKGRDYNGQRASNWRGGISPETKLQRGSIRMAEWRKAVFERDNYTCKICHRRGGKLNADYIKSFACFPELRFEISNGRTLCIPCHRKTPNYGRKAVL